MHFLEVIWEKNWKWGKKIENDEKIRKKENGKDKDDD